MAALRLLLTVAASLAVLIGAIWIGQGSGAYAATPSPFVASQTPWIYRGAALAVLGVLVLWRMRIYSR